MDTEQPWEPYPERILDLPLGGLELEVGFPVPHQVVMGAGGKPENEVYLDRLKRLNVPLYKRKGGGGTVLLGPGVLVVTVHAGVSHAYRNRAYFQAINHAMMGVFRTWKPLRYEDKGLSDIAVANRKIVGSSIYRRRQYLLYQASILVEADIEMIETLLKSPPRQPDYRKNRGHRDFITDLRRLGIAADTEALAEDLKTKLPEILVEELNQVGFRIPGS